MSNPITLFYSYARKDEKLRDQLEIHLAWLKLSGRITGWHRREILAGSSPATAIDQHLNSAQIILLLISSDFMATPYCYGEEMKHALERDKQKEARVIPILLRPVFYKGAPFEHLAMLPRDGVPITEWRDPDKAFAHIAEELERVLKELERVPPASSQEEPKAASGPSQGQGKVTPPEEEELIKIVNQSEKVPPQEEVLVELAEAVKTFIIKMEPDDKVSFTIKAGESSSSGSTKDLNIYVDDINITISDMGSRIREYHNRSKSNQQERELRVWRNKLKQEGQKFYGDLIQEDPDLKRALDEARRTVSPENLTLVFEGSREALGMPYELLYDGNTPLAFGNSLCRMVNDVPRPSQLQDFDAFIGRLQKRRSPLKILLIGTGGQDTPADQEITLLYGRIMQQAQEVGLRPKIDSIRPYQETVTYDKVTQQLRNTAYHIVHFVGQGTFDEHSGADAVLVLKKSEVSEEQVELSMSQLINLLNKSDMRLFYLGNCASVWADSDEQLDNSPYLGAMDAIVRAGIPYVLGFRWHVVGERGRLFADAFYTHLLRPPFAPERALWYARKQMGEADETWTSPILVAQYPYGWLDGKNVGR
jgi:CHAT domain-containing protein